MILFEHLLASSAERQERAESGPTIVAYGTPAIDVKLLLRIAPRMSQAGRQAGLAW
jgi:predicted aconitase